MVLWLQSEEYMGPEVPILPDNPTENDKQPWEFKMNDLLKIEHVLKGNLWNLFTVLMALCDTKIKNQVKTLSNFKVMDKKLDSMMLLKAI